MNVTMTTWGTRAIPPVERTDARLIVDPLGRLRDAHGRDVVMRGINTGGRSKYAPFLPFIIDEGAPIDRVRAAADAFFARLGPWGLDAVRLPFSWEALEPTRGHIDARYLDRYRTLIDSAWALGLRVIVDFHQDIYASPFCGDGFPLWTLEDPDPGPPRHDDPHWFFKYIQDAAVQRAFDRFWADEDGIQTAFEAMWRRMASTLADHPGVVGFEIINEPGWGTATDLDAWKREVLTPFHARLARIIQAEAPGALVFFDGPGIDALSSRVTHVRPEGEGLVFAPHLYDPGLITGKPWSGMAPEPPLEAMAEWRDRRATPILLGEFGVGRGASGGAEWLRRAMDVIDQRRLSATLWEHSENENIWNGEDLSVVDIHGQEREILDAYVRPWIRALAGELAGPTGGFTWDPAAGVCEVRWVQGSGVTEIAIPSRRFPEGPREVDGQGEGFAATWDPGRAELRVIADPGAEVALRFCARPAA